jgi:hypothetical protein
MNEARYFQFLAGERKKEIVIFDKIEEDDENVYVCFRDGSRCNEDLILPINEKDATGKIMAEIESPKNCWNFKDEWVGRQEEVWELNAEQERVCVQPFVAGRKIVHLIPPRNSVSKFGLFSKPVITTPVEPIPESNKKTLNTSDPVFITLDKAKKVDTDVDLVLTISLPPKNLYKVMKESFDNGGNKVIEYIIDNMDVSYLKHMIGEAVLTMYESQEIIEDNASTI